MLYTRYFHLEQIVKQCFHKFCIPQLLLRTTRKLATMNVRCQCNAVAFQTPTPKPLALYHCHCLECRRQSASAFGTSVIFPASPLFPLSAALLSSMSVYTRPTKSGGSMDCYFCRKCG